MPANYVLLEKITVGAAGASSVTFSGIPQTGYTDLVLKISPRQVAGGVWQGISLTVNGSTSTYSSKILEGGDSTATSANGGTTGIGMNSVGVLYASTFASSEVYIPNYTSSNYKSFSIDSVSEGNQSGGVYQDLIAGLWSTTSAITSITLTGSSNNFAQYSTFYLYGVAKLGTTPAIAPYATGGDTIMTDGTYWYHTFLSSGTFTPAKGLTCDYLVVAGGGGGGSQTSGNAGGYGGGGAGGLRSTVTATGGGGTLETALSLSNGIGYTVTIGAGGAAGTGGGRGTNGSNSVFSTITSTGGGGGASQGTDQGLSGGAGGGGGANGSNAGGTGTANQGFAGGQSNTGGYAGSGGGGAGAVGNRSAVIGGNGNAGAGGAGVAVSITGSSVTYAGGGGGGGYREPSPGTTTGGAGGAGGGGAGAVPNDAVAGTANLGGGGGGSGCITTGLVIKASAAGGSGIVIVRYAV